jgi:PEP-CTERM motif
LRGRLRKPVGEKPHFRDPSATVRSITARTLTGMYALQAAVGREGIKDMNIKRAATLCALGLLFNVSGGIVKAGTLTTVDDTVAADLANALTTGGAGGITITSESLSDNKFGSIASSGIFSTVGTNNFGLSGSGIVISTGHAAQDGTTGPDIYQVTTDFGTSATPSEASLLNQVASAPSGWNDATEFDVTFTAGPSTTHVFFNTVFTSAEYPVFIGKYIDGFGMFLNGANVAFAGGHQVNIDNPGMVNTVFPIDGGGNDGTAFQTTPEEGVLVVDGSAVITFGGDVTPGSTNTLTFIIADANDNELDTTAFIQGLGNAPPSGGPVGAIGTPEPATWAMMLLGFAGLGFVGYRRAARARTAALAAS